MGDCYWHLLHRWQEPYSVQDSPHDEELPCSKLERRSTHTVRHHGMAAAFPSSRWAGRPGWKLQCLYDSLRGLTFSFPPQDYSDWEEGEERELHNDVNTRGWGSLGAILGGWLKIYQKKHRYSKKPITPQWRKLPAPSAGGLGSIPGQGTRSHMLQLRSKTLCPTTET